MNREAQRVSVEQAMFMAGNNVDLAAAMIGYNERGAYMERREYRQAAESVRIARAAALGRPAVQRG
ncbi:MAG: hypothetical protein BWY92_01752 [Firmicutes bacterium ADurb.BinA052]|jgi:hypothetical protein|nr:MAG: hypothetical protein BWY92_01752 [Firmicutes bacterium ADurb.BinA052]